MTDQKKEKSQEEIPSQDISKFLESSPPSQWIKVSDSVSHDPRYQQSYKVDLPEIELHCSYESCNGTRFFRPLRHDSYIGLSLKENGYNYLYVTYICSNCQKTKKIFSLVIKLSQTNDGGLYVECYKIGEFPVYGPPIPSRLIKLVGPDREEFLKGRRCENQGLGVGSFIYYRRVVEKQKDRIIGEIVKVSQKIDAPEEKIKILQDAIKETQFSKALDMAKDAMPESLLINGHNPILLLHSALSEGVHALTDEQCLELANSVRVVLGELSERLSQALKDEAELTKALSTLINRSSPSNLFA